MDPAVALVQAYLQLNGYLTVAEFPIIAASRNGGDVVTDIDLLALRFPLARPVGSLPGEHAEPDPVLDLRDDAMDLLICEVKEGKARINPNLSRSDTLHAALARVGCCTQEHIAQHVRALTRKGVADIRHQGTTRCRVRLAIFAGRPGSEHRAPLVLHLRHAARFVCGFLLEHRHGLHAARLTQPALAHLHLLEKLDMFTAAQLTEP